MFQNYSLLPWLTVFENVYLAVDQVFPNWTAEQEARSTPSSYIAMVNLTRRRATRSPRSSRAACASASRWRARSRWNRRSCSWTNRSARSMRSRAPRCRTRSRASGRVSSKTVVLITNDVDEGILLADRIIPLERGPGGDAGPVVHRRYSASARSQGAEPRRDSRRIRAEVIE